MLKVIARSEQKRATWQSSSFTTRLLPCPSGRRGFARNDKRGIALLFTLLIIGVAISLSVGVFNIILGELQIGEGAGESMRAFFAADSGVECILYWDLKEKTFVFGDENEKEITCLGSSHSFTPSSQTIDIQAATVYKSPPCPGDKALTLSNNSCVTLTVIKFKDGTSRIEALGENINNPSAARVVQRGIEVNY